MDRLADETGSIGAETLGYRFATTDISTELRPIHQGLNSLLERLYAARQESTRKLYALAGLAVVGIVLLLFVDFQAWRPTLIVAFTIPFALIGGVVGVMLSGGVLSLGSIVGFVTVLGIAARNGIMMVSHYRHLEFEEGEPFGLSLVLRGAEERLSPILMTALATGLALVPLVIGGTKPGHEIEHPLAVVILGGLFTSTLLNLLFVPALYARFGRSNTPQELDTITNTTADS